MEFRLKVHTFERSDSKIDKLLTDYITNCMRNTFEIECEFELHVDSRPFDLTQAKVFIEKNIREYITLRQQCGFISIIAFKKLNVEFNTWIANVCKQFLQEFPDEPIAFFMYDKTMVSLVDANYNRMNAIIKNAIQQVGIPDFDNELDQGEITSEVVLNGTEVTTPVDNQSTSAESEGVTGTEDNSVVISFMGDASEYERILHQDQSRTFSIDTKFSVHYAYAKYQPRLAIVLCTVGVSDHFTTTLKNYVTFYVTSNVIIREVFETKFQEQRYVDPADNDMNIWSLVSIFDNLLERHNIQKDEKIILDVTHGYRIIPMFVMSLFRYLVSIKGFQPNNITILYANYRDNQNTCTVYEVTEFTSMDEWTDAAKGIMQHGNARAIKNLLTSYKLKHQDDERHKLSVLSEEIAKWAEVVQLAQWELYPNQFKSLKINIDDVLKITLAPEVKYVLEWILHQFADVIQLAVTSDNSSDNEIKIQEHILKWYLNCEMYTQAALLTREYLLSKYLIKYGTYVRTKRNNENQSWKWKHDKLSDGRWKTYWNREGKTNRAAKAREPMKIVLNTIYSQDSCGRKVSELRNAIAHGTMRPDINVTGAYVKDIVELALAQQITDAMNETITRELQNLDF